MRVSGRLKGALERGSVTRLRKDYTIELLFLIAVDENMMAAKSKWKDDTFIILCVIIPCGRKMPQAMRKLVDHKEKYNIILLCDLNDETEHEN